jgi:hypothetical protein
LMTALGTADSSTFCANNDKEKAIKIPDKNKFFIVLKF